MEYRQGDYLSDYIVDFIIARISEPVQHLAPERAPGWFGFGFGPVDAGDAVAVVSAECVFAVVDDDAAVEEPDAEGPDEGGEAAGGEEVVDVDYDFGLFDGVAVGAEGGAGVTGGRVTGGRVAGGHFCCCWWLWWLWWWWWEGWWCRGWRETGLMNGGSSHRTARDSEGQLQEQSTLREQKRP